MFMSIFHQHQVLQFHYSYFLYYCVHQIRENFPLKNCSKIHILAECHRKYRSHLRFSFVNLFLRLHYKRLIRAFSITIPLISTLLFQPVVLIVYFLFHFFSIFLVKKNEERFNQKTRKERHHKKKKKAKK